MKFELSQRLQSFPPYIFSEINRIKAEAEKKGIELLSVGIGDPDLPTPPEIVARLQEATARPQNHLYSPYEGTNPLKKAIAEWFQNRFSVEVNPENEVIALIGSKEGLAHFPLAFLNPGDKALYPSPGYPVFQTCLLMAGAQAVPFPLRADQAFAPSPELFESYLKEHKPKLAILNFPSNPTSATCSKEVLEALVEACIRHQCILAYDNAYSEIYFDGKKPLSILEIPKAKECAIEFHSFSKSYNMTGWRLGFAVGNPELVAGLLKVKTHVDSGPLLAVQEASIYALKNYEALGTSIREKYEPRRRLALEGLARLGIEVFPSSATFFIWARVPLGRSSMEFTKVLIENHGLVVTPGAGFGDHGEGFFRISLTVSEEKIKKALNKLEDYLLDGA